MMAADGKPRGRHRCVEVKRNRFPGRGLQRKLQPETGPPNCPAARSSAVLPGQTPAEAGADLPGQTIASGRIVRLFTILVFRVEPKRSHGLAVNVGETLHREGPGVIPWEAF